MSSDTSRLLIRVQMFSEIAIAAGFALGMIPFLYLLTCKWVIPLSFVSLVIAFVSGNRTLGMTVANVILAFVSFVPVVGFVTRLIGAALALKNLSILRKEIR